MAELCRGRGISNTSFYKWRLASGGMHALMIAQTEALDDQLPGEAADGCSKCLTA